MKVFTLFTAVGLFSGATLLAQPVLTPSSPVLTPSPSFAVDSPVLTTGAPLVTNISAGVAGANLMGTNLWSALTNLQSVLEATLPAIAAYNEAVDGTGIP